MECDDGGAWSPKAKAALTPAKAARHPHRAKAPPTNAQMTEWSQNPTNNARRRRKRIPQHMGNGLGVPRGDHPGDVIPGPSAGDSLVAGNIDLPEDVANNEFDDHLVDVEGTRRPKQTDSSCLATRPRKRNKPLAADIHSGAEPCVSPPRILVHTATPGLRAEFCWICLWRGTGRTSSQRLCGGGRKLYSQKPLAPGSPSCWTSIGTTSLCIFESNVWRHRWSSSSSAS